MLPKILKKIIIPGKAREKGESLPRKRKVYDQYLLKHLEEEGFKRQSKPLPIKKEKKEKKKNIKQQEIKIDDAYEADRTAGIDILYEEPKDKKDFTA